MHRPRTHGELKVVRRRWGGALVALLVLTSVYALGADRAGAATSVPALQLPWPTGQQHDINQGNGYNCNDHKKNDYWAIDFHMLLGQEVSAVAPGIVHRAEMSSGYGRFVWIDHGGGIVSLYGHLSEWVAADGARVQRGETIGKAGSTGNSTAAHLHFAMHQNASSYNNGDALLPEPMSGYTGFDRYGVCTGKVSPLLRSQPVMVAPVITGVRTWTSGVMVNVEVTYRDDDSDATGMVFQGANGWGWAREDHPFARYGPYGHVSVGRFDYPFNHLCGRPGQYRSDIEIWVYDATGLRSSSQVVHLACDPATTSPVLRGGGLGRFDFGTDFATVVAETTAKLGPPTYDLVQPSTCGMGDPRRASARQVMWTKPAFVPGTPTGLVLFADTTTNPARLIGYDYYDQGTDPTLRTAEGLGLGDTAADIARLYPGRWSYLSMSGGIPPTVRIALADGPLNVLLRPSGGPGFIGVVSAGRGSCARRGYV